MKQSKEWEELREKLADIEHQRWSDWQKYMHSKMEGLTKTIDIGNGNPAVIEHKVFPKELFDRWERQINTNYKDLSEKEKNSDREQVDRYLPIISQNFTPNSEIKKLLEDKKDYNLIELYNKLKKLTDK